MHSEGWHVFSSDPEDDTSLTLEHMVSAISYLLVMNRANLHMLSFLSFGDRRSLQMMPRISPTWELA
jgi:hypothetical protein